MTDPRPIVKDTAEDLVRELAALEIFVTKREDLGERIGNIVMRARALVGPK